MTATYFHDRLGRWWVVEPSRPFPRLLVGVVLDKLRCSNEWTLYRR